ncbi:MAG: phospholipase [Legionellales bacterium RIFCSPHIGHO2_12_FULL_42_9]|nr:MAG: phospholipase [Legionellales bacterium RIFCSPHIGHO2_12_FULL_42_9]
MNNFNRLRVYLAGTLLLVSTAIAAATPVKSMIIFGDSLSDTGNTSHLLKSLRQEESPSYLVRPLKVFVINKMEEFADAYYVPQMVLDAGIDKVTQFFDVELAPMLATIIGKIKRAPVVPGEPYWQDHFSNGQVWNEYLATMLNVTREDTRHFSNQAFGGSWTVTYDYQLTVWNLIRHPIMTLKSLIVGKLIPPSLGLTVQAHLISTTHFDKDAVYFIFSGGNDYLNVLAFGDNYDTAVMSVYIDNVLDSMNSAVQKLTNAGAKHLVIFGIPDVGLTPHFLYTADQNVLSAAVLEHNKRLKTRIELLQHDLPLVDFLFIDVQPMFEKVLSHPSNYGFTNTTEACIDVKLPMYRGLENSPFAHNLVLQYASVLQYRNSHFAAGEKNYQMCDQPDNYLFWDETHPSTRTHRVLAYEICLAMQDHGYQATCQDPTVVA